MEKITVTITIAKPVHEVFEYFTSAEHITKWNFAHESWECPSAETDLKEGGKFNYKMAAKDGSFAFDYTGTFDKIIPNELIEYHLDDQRKVQVKFSKTDDNRTEVTEIFDPESQSPAEMQMQGWQAILDNFKKYSEQQ